MMYNVELHPVSSLTHRSFIVITNAENREERRTSIFFSAKSRRNKSCSFATFAFATQHVTRRQAVP